MCLQCIYVCMSVSDDVLNCVKKKCTRFNLPRHLTQFNFQSENNQIKVFCAGGSSTSCSNKKRKKLRYGISVGNIFHYDSDKKMKQINDQILFNEVITPWTNWCLLPYQPDILSYFQDLLKGNYLHSEYNRMNRVINFQLQRQ